MTRAELLSFINGCRYAVVATVSPSGAPQAAVVGIAATEKLEIVFDTATSSRKAQNLHQNNKIAVVIGGLTPGDERTVQLDGIADHPTGPELERLKQEYYRQFPDGTLRLAWPGLVYVRVRPLWCRYSNFNSNPAEIAEFDLAHLA